MTLVLKVDAPKDGATVNGSAVTVSGRVLGTERASAKVSVNEAIVPVKDDKFSSSVTLKEGQNVINVAATATSGAKLGQKLNITYAPAK